MGKFKSMIKHQLNKLIAKHIGWTVRDGQYDQDEVCVINDYGHETTVDYCNSWADMGVIIESIWSELFDMSSNPFISKWDYMKEECGSPLKAAAIIYLESMEQNND